ncbi:adenosylcobinamide-GDP ribazoletransferase [uncultured Jatrophihabitans sp.]|uniref:adenosylcobinamide-GDP ribazoletransferase n=1 Tax=uncultured Jatrophihabitans sp. TaxID=1610747 RepID=UPI0035CAEE91
MKELRLAFGLFSVLPVGRVDPRPAGGRRAVLWLPVVGVVLALLSVLPALLVWHGCGHGSAVLAAVAVVAAQALLTRGLHLDGLADLADGLGSGRPPAGALDVMRRGDVGPFGVLAVVLSVLLQVAALGTVLAGHRVAVGVVAVAAAAMTGRLAVLWSAGRGVPAARPDGFGALVAGSIAWPAQLLSTVWVMVVLGAAALAAGASARDVGWFGGAMLAGLLAAWVVRLHAVRRLGGVSGDVFGALVEIAATTALLVLAAESAWR